VCTVTAEEEEEDEGEVQPRGKAQLRRTHSGMGGGSECIGCSRGAGAECVLVPWHTSSKQSG
jgi:hypothetical protein